MGRVPIQVRHGMIAAVTVARAEKKGPAKKRAGGVAIPPAHPWGYASALFF